MRIDRYFLCLALATPALGQDLSRRLANAPQETRSVLTDRAPDGTLWARGSDWKVRFGTDGVSYSPRFGRRAPRNSTFDLSLTYASIGQRPLLLALGALPVLAGDRVEYERGPFQEVWKLAPLSVEQTFVLPEPLGAGDLVLEFGPRTDLAYRGRSAGGEGLVFENPGIGSLSYGDLTVIDANGQRSTFESTFVAGRIVLRVPAHALDHAAYPLTLDPLIQNLSIDTDAEDDEDPDVAHGLSRYLVVYENVFSASDRDIISRRYEEDGTFLEEIAVDVTNEDTVDPAVAANNSDFMIVWNQRADGSLFSDNVIRGRRRIGGSTVQAAAFDISTNAKNEEDPDVGGTQNLIARPFFVVWSEDPLIGGAETHGRTVDALGNSLGNDVFFGLGNLTDGPRISKSARNIGRYVVTWETLGTTHRFIDAQLVTEGGAKLGALVIVGQNLLNVPFHADVDGDGTHWMVVREVESTPNNTDIVATILGVNGSGALFSQGELNLSNLDLGAAEGSDQTFPAVGSEGCRFTYAYLHPESGSIRQIRTSTRLVSETTPPTFAYLEKAEVLGSAGQDEHDLSIASTHFHDPGTVLLAWTRDPNVSNSQIDGSLRTTLKPGGVTLIQTGCGAPEPVLFAGPSMEVGGTASILIGNTSSNTPLVAIGTQANIPLCPGQAPCVLGVNPILLQPLPLLVNAPLPCDPALIGFEIAVQVIDILPANATGVFCGPPKFSQKVRVSDTAILKFQ